MSTFLGLKQGENIRVRCEGIWASFGTKPRQKHRETVSDEEQWTLLGRVVDVDDPRQDDFYQEEAERRGINITELMPVDKMEVVVRGWESRDDYNSIHFWSLEQHFGSGKITMSELPRPAEANLSPGGDSPRQSEAIEIISEDKRTKTNGENKVER